MSTEDYGSTKEEHRAQREGPVRGGAPEDYEHSECGEQVLDEGRKQERKNPGTKPAKPPWDHAVLPGGSEFPTLEARVNLLPPELADWLFLGAAFL